MRRSDVYVPKEQTRASIYSLVEMPRTKPRHQQPAVSQHISLRLAATIAFTPILVISAAFTLIPPDPLPIFATHCQPPHHASFLAPLPPSHCTSQSPNHQAPPLDSSPRTLPVPIPSAATHTLPPACTQSSTTRLGTKSTTRRQKCQTQTRSEAQSCALWENLTPHISPQSRACVGP